MCIIIRSVRALIGDDERSLCRYLARDMHVTGQCMMIWRSYYLMMIGEVYWEVIYIYGQIEVFEDLRIQSICVLNILSYTFSVNSISQTQVSLDKDASPR